MLPGKRLLAILITLLFMAASPAPRNRDGKLPVPVVDEGEPLGHPQSADDRYPFIRDGKLGYIDSQGNEVIPPRFGNASDGKFNNGLASVFEVHRGFGYIDTSGNFVIGPTFDFGWGRPFYDGIAGVLLIGKNGAENKPAWIDREGNVVHSGIGIEGTHFSDGLMPMPRDGKWGYVNRKFEFVIPPQFDFAYGFSEGRAEVTIKHKSGFIDTSGKIIIPFKYDMAWVFQDGLARVRYDIPDGTMKTFEGEETKYQYKYGYVDHDGNEVIPPQFPEATYFSEGYAFVIPPKSKRFAIIDKKGNLLTKPLFDDAEEFSEGLAKACVRRKCGYVDSTGAWVIRPSLTYAEKFWHGLARVSWTDSDYGYVDKTGRQVWRIGKKSAATRR